VVDCRESVAEDLVPFLIVAITQSDPKSHMKTSSDADEIAEASHLVACRVGVAEDLVSFLIVAINTL
jgi:hypothetical protein